MAQRQDCGTMTDELINISSPDNVCDTSRSTGFSSKRARVTTSSRVITLPNMERNTDFLLLRESNKLLSIFPEEIWLMIMGIMDKNGKENMCNASRYLRQLLLPQRVLFLFPAVWNILAVKYHTASLHATPDPDTAEEEEVEEDFEGEVEREVEGEVEEIPQSPDPPKIQCISCGRSRSIKWYSEILKLRLVCRTWVNEIDCFYQKLPLLHESHILEPSKDVFAHTSKWAENMFHDRRNNLLYNQQFLQHFNQSHGGTMERSPFFGKRCVIEDFRQNRNAPIYNEILGKYGLHIWYCTIYISVGFTTMSECYMALKFLLDKMPNLKEINIHFWICASYGYRLSPEIHETINSNPLPALPNLRGVRIENLPAPIFNELIRQNSQINMITVQRKPEYEFGTYTFPVLNLKQLKTKILSNEDFQRVEVFPETWSLEKLELDVDRFYSMFIEWPRVFTVLEKYSESLTHLHLNLQSPTFTNVSDRFKMFPDRISSGLNDNSDLQSTTTTVYDESDKILKDSISYRLHLPKMKSLKVRLDNISCLDFILPMKDTLEYLEVTIHYEFERSKFVVRSVMKQQVIQFFGYMDCMHKSNIWILFPKLERLDLIETCERDADEGDPVVTVTYTRQQVLDEMKFSAMGMKLNAA